MREFLPEGVEIPPTPRYLAAIAAGINGKIHDWRKPTEVSPNSPKQMRRPPELAAVFDHLLSPQFTRQLDVFLQGAQPPGPPTVV